jgi:hypothetical protein
MPEVIVKLLNVNYFITSAVDDKSLTLLALAFVQNSAVN